MQKYDIAAYIWPAYTGKEPRAYQFWPEKHGEWESVKSAEKKFNGHCWPRKPVWGYQDEADPAVMEMQIKEALSHGVNIFIYDWYWYDNRPFLEQCLNDGFLKAKNSTDMKFCLMWANHDAGNAWDKRLSDIRPFYTIWNGAIDKKQFEFITKRNIEKYFVRENYYKIDGKPVFIIYDINNLIKGLGGVDSTAEAIQKFRNDTKKAGFKDLFLMLILNDSYYDLSGVDGNGKNFDSADIVKKLNFDGITHYQMAHFTDVNRDYEQIIPDMVEEWNKQSSRFSVPYFPHVSIGWDNNPRFHCLMENIAKNNTPENFEKALKLAKEFVDGKTLPVPLITINSWNEWTESSYLEPDNIYGYGYLDAVKKVFLK